MARVEIHVSGIKALKRELNGRFANAARGTLAAVHKPARDVMRASSAQVPRDTEALANSAFLRAPYLIGDEVIVEFGYGSTYVGINPKTGQSSDEYAWIVHEDLEAKHPIGKAKFLEDPLVAYAPQILSNIGGSLSKFFK